MRFSVLILVACLLVGILDARFLLKHNFQGRNPNPVKTLKGEQWFDAQRLDHFDMTETRTWNQRYLLNSTYFNMNDPNAPVFIDLGGEGPMGEGCINGKYIQNEYAKEVNALLLCAEHRFYGKSMPLPDLSVKSLKYLNADQALADYADFIQYIKQTFLYNDPYVETRKWIAFGGSYSGNLAAWLRLKYPHLIHAAIASSAPIVAQLKFPEYATHVAKAIGGSCTKKMREATLAIEDLVLRGGLSGQRKIEQLFGSCNPFAQFSTPEDIATFFGALSDPVCGVVQYNLDNNALGRMFNITEMCWFVEQSSTDPVQGYANFIKEHAKRAGDNCVENSYANMIKQLKDINSWEAGNNGAAGRAWTWQYCNEYGYIQYFDEATVQPFSGLVSLDWQMKICEDAFDIKYLSPKVDEINTKYGSDKIKSSRISFALGSIDPWTELGFKKTAQSSQQILIPIEGTAHCANLYATSPKDLPSLKAARQQEWALLRSWLKEN